jgi:hypothetical protein
VTFPAITGSLPFSCLYSFIENYRRDAKSLREAMAARFGNGWAHRTSGTWAPLAKASFTENATPIGNIDVGIQEGVFYLAQEGDTVNHTEIRFHIVRDDTGVVEASWQGSGT